MLKYDHESALQAAFRHFWQWALTERQLIVRSKGQIRFVPLSRIIQTGLIGLVFAGGGWFVYSTVKYFDLRNTVFTQETVIARSETAYRTLVEEMADSRKRFVSLVRLLGQNQGEVLELVEKNDALKSKMKKAAQSGGTPAPATATKQKPVEKAKLDAAKPAAPTKKIKIRKEARLDAQTNTAKPAAGQDVTFSRALAALEGKATQVEGRSRLMVKDLPGNEIRNDDPAASDAKDAGRVERLDNRVVKLARRLAVVRNSQNKLLNLIARQTQENIQHAENIIKVTDLDVKVLLKRIGASNLGQGGPFVPLRPNDLRADSFRSGLSSLNMRMERWQDLQKILRQLPLAMPMKSAWISGKFGRRRDPFRKRWAMHRGTDIAAGWHAPIYASAPGRIRHAGWKGRYGKLVEIDHGMGIRTRYAHMFKVTVKKGQSVDFQQKVGEQGNTGRSKSAHLHYEILVNGKQVNPINFLQAGEHVYKK